MDKQRLEKLAGLSEGFANETIITGVNWLAREIVRNSNQTFPVDHLRTDSDKQLAGEAKLIVQKAADELLALKRKFI